MDFLHITSLCSFLTQVIKDYTLHDIFRTIKMVPKTLAIDHKNLKEVHNPSPKNVCGKMSV